MQLSSITTPIATAAGAVFSAAKGAGNWGVHAVTVVASKGAEAAAWSGAVLAALAKSTASFCKTNAKPIGITVAVGLAIAVVVVIAKKFFGSSGEKAPASTPAPTDPAAAKVKEDAEALAAKAKEDAEALAAKAKEDAEALAAKAKADAEALATKAKGTGVPHSDHKAGPATGAEKSAHLKVEVEPVAKRTRASQKMAAAAPTAAGAPTTDTLVVNA